MYNPKISIIIPAYNAANYLREAIDSALGQTYRNFEIIVVNDGSDDHGATEEIALSYKDQITYLQKENGGVSSALNYAVKHMSGEWFSWLSHDDLYHPDKLSKQVFLLNKLHERGDSQLKRDRVVVFSDSSLIDAAGNAIPKQQRTFNTPDSTTLDIILNNLRRNNLMGCTFLVPKSSFDEYGGFDEKLRAVQDFDFWYRLLFAGYTFRYLPEKLVAFRVHENQVTFKIPDRIKEERSMFYQQAVIQLGDHEDFGTFRTMFTLGCYLSERGNEPEAVRIAFRSAREKGSALKYGILSIILRPWVVLYGRIRCFLKQLYFGLIIRRKSRRKSRQGNK